VRTLPRRQSQGPRAPHQALALLLALALPATVAGLGGWVTSRSVDTWYRTLRRPTWTPSGRLIGAIWTVLYALMGIGSWLVWRAGASDPARGQAAARAQRLYLVQLALNLGWSFAFFGLRSTAAGLAVIVPLWVAILAWVRAAGRASPLAGRLQVPYVAWVAFAATLNAAIWRRN
jgi:tryptophan-rich sensory protein